MNKQEIQRLERLHLKRDNPVLLKNSDPICNYYYKLRDKEIANRKEQKKTYNIDIESQQRIMSIFGALIKDDKIRDEDFHKILALRLKEID